ncbi:MAG: rhodanese-like domain-containing protein [Algibacter sp.]
MKQLLFIFCILISIVFVGCKESVNLGIQVISQEEMQTFLKLDDVQLIDVRTPEEYKTGFIADAQNIDFYSSTFAEDISKLDKSKPVLLYCKSGGRSAKCAKKLLKAGFVKIYDLEGGISKWEHSGLKVNTTF